MNQLPSGWASTTLGEIAPLRYGKSLTGALRTGTGSILVYGSSGLIGKHDTPLIEHETLIVGRKGTVGAVYHVTEPSWVIDTAYFVEDSDNLNWRYLYYLLHSKKLGQLDRSTAIPGLSRDDYDKVDADIAPVEEQNRIVAEIEKQFSRLDAATAALKRVRANLKRYRKSVLKAACEGRLVPTEAELARKEGREYEPADKLLERILRERRARWETDTLAKMIASGKSPKGEGWKHNYKEPLGLDTSSLPQLPEGWVWTTAEVVADAVDPHPSHRTPPAVIDGIPYIGMGDISETGRIDRENARKVARTVLEEHRERYSLQLGDFVLGKIGTIGSPVLVEEPFDYALSANVVLIQPHGCPLLFWYMSTAAFNHMLIEGSRATTQAAFGIQKMRVLPCPLPPLEEQHRLVTSIEEKLSAAAHIEELIDVQLIRCNRLSRATLKNAFEGKLAPQNPDDEPASALLERIRCERDSGPKTGVRRRRREFAHA